MGLLSIAVLSIAAAALTGCQVPEVFRSSSIVYDEPSERLFVTSPDDRSLVVLDARSQAELEEQGRIQFEGTPHHISGRGDTLVMTQSDRSAIVLVDKNTLATTTFDIPCGSSFAVTFAPGRTFPIAVACLNSNRVLLLDESGTLLSTILFEGKPSALVRRDDELFIGLTLPGALVRLPLTFEPAPTDVQKASDLGATRELLSIQIGVAANRVNGIDIHAELGPLLSFQRAGHDDDRTRPASAGGYGALVDGNPRIEPQLHGACSGRYATYDGGAQVFAGPSALTFIPNSNRVPNSKLVLVAHKFTDNIALLDCSSTPPTFVTSFAVGRGPRGLATSVDGTRAYVDVGFAAAVARLDLTQALDSRTSETSLEKKRTLESTTLSALALTGRDLFFDATNTHLTPSGIVACATCHPHGQQDGLNWFLNTPNIPRRVRRTTPAWGGGSDFAPFHWDGEFDNSADLVTKGIRELMNGDALLVDTAAMGAYLDELRPPPPMPSTAIANTSVLNRGEAIFNDSESGCVACHIEDTSRLYPPVASESADLDARLDTVSAPPLAGVFSRAPYFHDGRFTSLDAVFATNGAGPDRDRHGVTSSLTASDLEALILYLRTQ